MKQQGGNTERIIRIIKEGWGSGVSEKDGRTDI